MNDENNIELGRKIILNAIEADETLINILKNEFDNAKSKIIDKEYVEIDYFHYLTKLFRNVIISMTLNEEKLQTGVSLIEKSGII